MGRLKAKKANAAEAKESARQKKISRLEKIGQREDGFGRLARNRAAKMNAPANQPKQPIRSLFQKRKQGE
jgi:hypothetical protein